MEELKQIWPEWQIEEKPLGRGSYGVVYKAVRKDYNVESYTAIKVISIPSDSSEVDSLRSEGLDMNATRTYLQGIVEDFVEEIRMMESLKGVQNIVSVEDYKVVEKKGEIGWNIYIRMELLMPFNSYICDKKLSEEEVIKLGIDICTALEICGKRNVIHRDIKPENIFINDFGDFKLGDFGIARKMENVTGGLSQKGTFNYMAPEIVTSNSYDARVDTYSLGVVMYRLLNGNRLPFLDNENQLLNPNERRNAVDRRLRGEKLPPPREATAEMAEVVLKACAYDPDVRFASATEMKQTLKRVLDGTYSLGALSGLDKTTAICGAVGVTKENSSDVNKTVSVCKPLEISQPLSDQPVDKSGKAPALEQQMFQNADISRNGLRDSEYKPVQNVNTFDAEPKKNSKLPIIILVILAVILFVGAGVLIAMLSGDNEGKNSSGNLSSEYIDNNISSNDDVVLDSDDDTEDEEINASSSEETTEKEEVDAIIADAKELALIDDYEGALNEIEEGLKKFPHSEELKSKKKEYTSILLSVNSGTSSEEQSNSSQENSSQENSSQENSSQENSSQENSSQENTSQEDSSSDNSSDSTQSGLIVIPPNATQTLIVDKNSKSSATIAPAEFLTYNGNISKEKQVDKYTYKVLNDGRTRIDISGLKSEVCVHLMVYDLLGNVVAEKSYCYNGDGLTLKGLKVGEVYNIEVKQKNGYSDYCLTIGQAKPAVDVGKLTTIKDSVEFTDQRNVYWFTAPSDGRYRIDLSEMKSNMSLKLSVYDDLDYEIAINSYCESGEGVTLKGLKKGATYQIIVICPESSGCGDYTMSIGYQKPTIDISTLSEISDSIEFTDQRNVYTFTAPLDGRYRFDISDMKSGVQVEMRVFDSLDEEIGVNSYCENNEGVTLIGLKAGEIYEIQIRQKAGYSDYKLHFGKQKPSTDISSGNIISDSIDHTDQRNVYNFTANKSGTYTFTISELQGQCRVELCVYDRLDEKIAGITECSNGEGVTLNNLTPGDVYSVQVRQRTGYSDYLLTVR